ncbi:MAG: APC family permease [Proteobacteria bacterium]|nr:APC family permease [Pseudomonadota bacterium]
MNSAPALRGDIGYFQFLSLSFGTMIGSAWVILLGDWLGKAGPGGAVLGFLSGALIVMTIGACYAELASHLPEAGSEFIYAHRVYGRGLAFTVGWFLVLYLVSVTVFEALALAWIAELLFPDWQSLTLYSVFGGAITWQTLLVGIGGALCIFALNLAGTRAAVVGHSILTFGFLFVVLCILAALLTHGQANHARPLFATTNGKPWWLGSFGIFSFCAYALNGFQAIPQAIEERSGKTRLRSIGMVIVASIAAAACFYCIVVIAASLSMPWQRLVDEPLPMIAAAATLPQGQMVARVLLVATAVSLIKAWNGVFMMAVRLVLAMARTGYVPGRFARLHPRLASPVPALCLVASLNVAGIFWGRAAIEPITDMCAMVLTLTYVMCCATVLRLRARAGTAEGMAGSVTAFKVPGGSALVWTALIGSVIMTLVAFLAPWWGRQGLPLEWVLLIAWGAIGAGVWWSRERVGFTPP